jgi:hypothetical protein
MLETMRSAGFPTGEKRRLESRRYGGAVHQKLQPP